MLATGNPEYPRRVACLGTRKVSTDREITDSTYLMSEFPSGLTLVVMGTTVNEKGIEEVLRGRKATIYFSTGQNRVELKPERVFAEEVDPEEFADPQPPGQLAPLEKNWFDCIRSGGAPVASIDLAIRAHTVLCLAEMSERLSQTLIFDDKTRKIVNGEGKAIAPIGYATVLPGAS
jgi:hypothetical protein